MISEMISAIGQHKAPPLIFAFKATTQPLNALNDCCMDWLQNAFIQGGILSAMEGTQRYIL